MSSKNLVKKFLINFVKFNVREWKKEGNLHCKCESFYQEFLTLDIIMASESEYIFKLNWLYLLLMLLFPQMCCIMIMQFIVKKFFTFPKGSKFLYIFLMRGRRHRNMRFGNSKRYITIKIYKQHDSWIKRKKSPFMHPSHHGQMFQKDL